METRDLELHEKEEELFLQLEKVVRLEEDCEKVSRGSMRNPVIRSNVKISFD